MSEQAFELNDFDPDSTEDLGPIVDDGHEED